MKTCRSFALFLLCAFVLSVIFTVPAMAQEETDSETAVKAKESFNMGLEAQKNGNVTEAATYYTAAITSDPTFADAYLNRGSIYFQQEQYSNAEADFKKATELQPEDPLSWSNLGKVYVVINKRDEAISAFQAALDADKQFAEANKELGKLYFKNNQYAEAIAALEAYVAVDPQDQYSHYLLGMAYKKQKNTNKAIASFQKALEIDPNDFESLNNLGSIYLTRGNYANAIDYYERALKVKPKEYRTARNLAIAVQSQDPENYDASIAAWQRFISVAKKNTDSRAQKFIAEAESLIKQLEDAKAIGG